MGKLHSLVDILSDGGFDTLKILSSLLCVFDGTVPLFLGVLGHIAPERLKPSGSIRNASQRPRPVQLRTTPACSIKSFF